MSDVLDPLFAGCTPREIEEALHCFVRETVSHGTPILLEGEEAGGLIVVADGELEIRTGALELWTARAGEMVGEIGLFTRGVRTATVESNTEAELLILTHRGYERLVSRDSPVAMRIERMALDSLVARLRGIDQRIAELAKGTVVSHKTPTPSYLERVARALGVGGARRAPQLDRTQVLATSRLFSGVSAKAVSEIAANFVVEGWQGGEFLCTEGEPGEALFLIAHGAIDVLVQTHSDRVEPVATLAHGDAFGMAGLVDSRPRTASCVTRGDTVTLRLERSAWHRVSGQNTPGARALRVAMIRSLAESIATANAQLALLDLTSQTADLTPLLMASAAVEALPFSNGG